MKLFGEYLVEKKYISDEQLLSVLVRQLEIQPSIAAVAAREKVLPAKDLLEIFKLHFSNRISFLEAAALHPSWSEELQVSLQKKWQSTKIPLGELLVKEKMIDLGTLTKALDEYFAERFRKETPPQLEASPRQRLRKKISEKFAEIWPQRFGADPLAWESLLQLTQELGACAPEAQAPWLGEIDQGVSRILLELGNKNRADLAEDVRSKIKELFILFQLLVSQISENPQTLLSQTPIEKIQATVARINDWIILLGFDLEAYENVTAEQI